MQNSRSVILSLAHQLIKNGTAKNFSDAQKIAWQRSKSEQLSVITFTKKDGTQTKRVVTRNISKYYTLKGTGKAKPDGLTLFVDYAKVCKGEQFVIISTYDYKKVA